MGRRTPPTHMPEVDVPAGWKPPAMLPGDEPGDWDVAAADVAAAEVIHRALVDPSPPFAAYGIAIDFRWWERPRRLWARHATKRTAAGLGF